MLGCTTCGHPVTPHCKYVAVFNTPDGGLRLEVGCEHRAVVDVQHAHAILASGGCFARWMALWLDSLDDACRLHAAPAAAQVGGPDGIH